MGQIIRLIDSHTKENVNYEEVTTWYNGSLMDDTKVDNTIYRKKGGKYYASCDFLRGGAMRAELFGVSPNNPDNSTALQRAINLASSYRIGKIMIPAGTFKFGSPVYLRTRVAIEGLNPMRTFFTSDNDIAILTWFKHVEFVGISNITFMNSVAGRGKGISNPYFLQSENEGGLPYMSKSFIRNCYFRTNLKECIEGNILATTIEDCVFGYDGNVGYSHRHLNLRGDLVYATLNLNYVKNCMFTRAKGGESCYISKGNSFKFIDCDWELNQSTYTISIEGVNNVLFDNCWWETHGQINASESNPNSKYLIYTNNSPTQEGTSNILGVENLIIRNSNIIFNTPNEGIIKLYPGSALNVNIYNNLGSYFDNNKHITHETNEVLNGKLISFYGNRFKHGITTYSTVANVINTLNLVTPKVSTKGFSRSAWLIDWSTTNLQGWAKTDITAWAVAAKDGYFGNAMRITNGTSHNSIYLILPIEYFKGKKIGIRALGKNVSGTADLGIGYRLNTTPISSLTRPMSNRFGANPTELYTTVDIPSDAASLAVGLYQGGQTGVHDLYAFDVWILDSIIPLFSL